MRKIVIGIGVGLLVVAAGGGAYFYSGVRAGQRGPELARCTSPALALGRFSEPVRISDGAGPGTHTEVSAAVLPSGTLAAAFIVMTSVFSDTALGVATVGLDGKVDARPFRSAKKRHYDPWLSVDRAGLLHMVWLGHDSGIPEKRMEVGHATSQDAIHWSAPALENDVATDCPNEERGCLDKPIVAALPDGMMLLYGSVPGGGLKAKRIGQGQPSVLAAEAVLAGAQADATGKLHLVTVEGEEGPPERYGSPHLWLAYHSSSDGGRTFSESQRITPKGEPFPMFMQSPRVAADSERGFIYAVYAAGAPDLRWDIQLATSHDAGATWSYRKLNDDAPCASHALPAMALDPKTGRVHVIWAENRSGVGGIAYASCEPGGAQCSPNEAASGAFATYRLGRHGSDWLGDYMSLVADPERRTLHAVWSQPVGVDGTAVSRIFHARASLDR